MANTYTQLHIHIVFAVKYRDALINPCWETDLYKYITGIVQSQGHKVIQINGMPDHIHILIGLRPCQSLAHLMMSVKSRSANWINSTKQGKRRFIWQSGYGAFSVSRGDLGRVANYIRKQKIHHQRISFDDELISALKENEIEFNRKYLLVSPIDNQAKVD
ncbi:IS200/IS605 family transposase [Fulvivirga sedimenti]|uniref:IS200/IS605 family transposase n=1 Tax=Fulvivirga sedimenti TaxID=2879465 RepID=A0A9X1HXR1_9BACT|nr:IS200/IS605 family transposase [Fulvivirga sedimenti]MCA6079255.1 IS200/IS605 family transposase [Fulvivirga sedimenti]